MIILYTHQKEIQFQSNIKEPHDNLQVLVVQEKHRAPASVGLWKIPTGFVLEVEYFYLSCTLAASLFG